MVIYVRSFLKVPRAKNEYISHQPIASDFSIHCLPHMPWKHIDKRN
jgi:hypothetical protein